MDDAHVPAVIVFRGSRAACNESSLVLEARAIPFQLLESEGGWALIAPPDAAAAARAELARYAEERAEARQRARERGALKARVPFPGAVTGAIAYSVVLLGVAHAAGATWFAQNWLDAGALDRAAGGIGQWWRAVTALTLHLDPAHLLGNLVYGVAVGVLCSRLLGPGIAWASILAAGSAANYLELLIAPAGVSAVGASTAVFAGIGLLSGYAWRQRLTLRERWLYRWTPLLGGVSLLALLGAGDQHVDVLGHLLGFLSGLLLGWLYALGAVPRSRARAPQFAAAGASVLLIVAAWALALRAA